MSATETATDGLLNLRQRLLANGFMPLPANGKGGLPKAWPTRARTEGEVGLLHRTHQGYASTGIRCDGLVAIDIDVFDRAVAESIELVAMLWLGASDLRRVGRAPKALLVFRCDDVALRKTATRVFTLNGATAQVECLAGNGAQFIAFGIHPGTGRPYAWGDATPETTPVAELPVVSADALRTFKTECEAIILAAGGVPREKARAAESSDTGPGDHKPSVHGPEASLEDVAAALEVLPNDGDWDAWTKIGLAVFAATGGSEEGHQLFDGWSSKNFAYDPDTTRRRWDEISGSPPHSIGAGTLFRAAQDACPGFRRPSEPTPGSEFGTLPPLPPKPDADAAGEADDAAQSASKRDVIDYFNDRYMVVNEAGKAIIYAPKFDPILNRHYNDHLAMADLRALYMNRSVRVGKDAGGNATYKPAAEVWLRSPRRRQFIDGVKFDPSGTTEPGVLNLWRGFSVEAAPGDWSLMREHIEQIICDGDPVRIQYLMGWLARMVQFPGKQGETAVVMRGLEGCGKGTLPRALMKMLGQHGLAVSNAKHLVGNFNGHLRDCVLLFADEAFFAGDRQHVGVLKSIITEPHLTIEAKFANATPAPNMLHVMMASNNAWVVPASVEARRFFVLDVPTTKIGDHAYFGAIWAQMDAGGYGAMLHDLLTMDLTGFNVRSVPVTAGLQEQKKLSLPTAEAWWLDVLLRGYVGPREGAWREKATTGELFTDYGLFADKRHDRHPLTREDFGRFMVRMGGQRVRLGARRAPGYRLGLLARAREDFTRITGLSVEWGDPDAEMVEDDDPRLTDLL